MPSQSRGRGGLGPQTGRSRCSLDVPWARQPSGRPVKWPPAPPTPQASCPQDLEQCLGGCHQIPRVQEEPWNLGLGCSGSLGMGCLRGLGGDVGVGDRVLVAIWGTAWTLRTKVPIVRRGVQGWPEHGLRFRDPGEQRSGPGPEGVTLFSEGKSEAPG